MGPLLFFREAYLSGLARANQLQEEGEEEYSRKGAKVAKIKQQSEFRSQQPEVNYEKHERARKTAEEFSRKGAKGAKLKVGK
jgi:hypothetical protein